MTYTINKNYESNIEVMKSKFISYLFPVKNIAEVKYFLENLKKNHIKARHICYAYKIDGTYKYSDDGEPSGTAGKPLFNLLEQKELDNVLICVVRYFGGTLLGAGRLMRTYLESGVSVVDKAKLCEVVTLKEIECDIDISIYDKFRSYLNVNHFDIIKVNFNDKINIVFQIPLDFVKNLTDIFYPSYEEIRCDVVKVVKE